MAVHIKQMGALQISRLQRSLLLCLRAPLLQKLTNCIVNPQCVRYTESSSHRGCITWCGSLCLHFL